MNYSLRELSKRDLPAINRWRNDRTLIDLLGNNFLYIAQEVDEAWYENYLRNRQNASRFAIVAADDKIIGTVQLTGIHSINRSAEFSIMIGDKEYWSKGAGYFATVAIIQHGFKDLNLHRLWLTVLESNTRAISLYEKAGFKREGLLREALFKNGEFVNLIQMSLLQKEGIKQ